MMRHPEDFEYPMPKRQTNWTLRDEEIEHKNRARRAVRPTNVTGDIPGAQPCTTPLFRSQQFHAKPDLYSPTSIDGASPKVTVQASLDRHKTHSRCLRNDDIEHSYPESKLFSTPRVVDPLNPIYPLPRVRQRLPTPPPHRHTTLKTSDIDGTQPKHRWTRSTELNHLDYSDVSAKPQIRRKASPNFSLETRDINQKAEHRFVSGRTVNPLDPVYRIPGGSLLGSPSLGVIDGSKPKLAPQVRKDRPMMSLHSDDIDGARPTNHVPFPKERRHWKNTCDISDIKTKGRPELF